MAVTRMPEMKQKIQVTPMATETAVIKWLRFLDQADDDPDHG